MTKKTKGVSDIAMGTMAWERKGVLQITDVILRRD